MFSNILSVIEQNNLYRLHPECDFPAFISIFLLGVVVPADHQDCAFWDNLPIPALPDRISPCVSSELSLIEIVWTPVSSVCSAGWLRSTLRISQLLSLWMCHQAFKLSLLLWSLLGPYTWISVEVYENINCIRHGASICFTNGRRVLMCHTAHGIG